MRPDDSITRFEIVPYFHGKVLDISEGVVKAFPHFISHIECRVDDPHKLGMFADGSLDAVFSSNVLHLVPKEDLAMTLREWARVVRDDGHIVVHLPRDKASRETLTDAMPGRWQLVEYKNVEDSVLAAFRVNPSQEIKTELPEKRAAVVRLGAFGDMIQASSVLPWLKEQGYHVTLYCSDYGHEVVKHDPHIDRFIVQGRDEMPPAALGRFWEHEAKKYDRWINLSGTVEDALLPGPGSAAHGWPNEVRAKYLDRNYLEFTHEVAQVPPPYRPKFYSTAKEREWARFQKRKFGRINILWSLSGSSVHKAWPHMDATILSILPEYPDAHVVLAGDEASKVLEAGWVKWEGSEPRDASPRVHCRSGRWSIRESMAFAEVADLIVGTETGLLNAAGSMDTPKIVTLSHSSANMLTKHWRNAIALTQGAGGCAKFPCRQLHTNGWEHCNRHESGDSAMCQHAISAAQMMGAIRSILDQKRMAA